MLDRIKKYTANIYFNLFLFYHYPSELVSIALEKAMALGFTILLWNLIIDQVDAINSIRYLVGYYMISDSLASMFMVSSQKLGAYFRKNIQSGQFSNVLIKPVSNTLFPISTVLGERMIENVIALVTLCVGIIIIEPASIFGIGIFLIFCLFSFTISMSLNLFEGIMTFYVTNPGGIMNTISHISRILSGTLIPLSLMPDAIAPFINRSPFAIMIYQPINSLSFTHFNNEVFTTLLFGLMWSVLLVFIMNNLWNRALKSYEAVGL